MRCGAVSSASMGAGSYRRFGPSRGTHLRVRTIPAVVICEPGNFLDLAGRAGAVIDQHALAEPQLGDVALAHHGLLGEGRER